MNDFSRASQLLFSIIFADDTSVFIEGTHYNGVIEILNEELKKIEKWLKANKLTVNLKKTMYMVFHRAKIKQTKQQVVIDNQDILLVNHTKFLGVIIDNKLNWTEHITYVKNKISKSIGILYKTRKYLDKNTLRKLYYTFVYPYLIYCVEIWGNACNTYLVAII